MDNREWIVMCRYCGVKLSKLDDSNCYVCTNLRCNNNDGDKCPLCNTLTLHMGDDALLFNCNKCNFIWSYHYGCQEFSNPTDNHSEFIGYLLYDYNEGCSSTDYVTYIKTHDKFVKCSPCNVPYEYDSTFVWKCLRCNQEYANMYST